MSGTIDGLIQNAITKMSHIHFVSNEAARVRLIPGREREETIFHRLTGHRRDELTSPSID